ncbi:UDP-4-amino-4,6-dideoxy-N-acetyl-beta-L-altrosamine transaminase [Flavitalea antarctica]
MNNIPYGRQTITDDDIKAVTETLKSDFLTQGPKIAEFETAFADYIGARYAVAVSNGTAALHLCTLALNVDSTSNVITSPITFAASANCVRYCGGNVYFADIDEENFCLDLEKTKELIESKPMGFFQGIIPVDFAGNAINLLGFRDLANQHNLWIIEDACHAPGGYFMSSDGRKLMCGNGELAELAIFSFHPVKHIACGEGGMITTNDESLYKRLLLLRTHGITKDPAQLLENHGGWYYEMQVLGYNYRITDFQAALGISQLKRADIGLARRRILAKKYFASFCDKPFIKRQSGFIEGHAYHLYIIQTSRRKELYDFLRSRNIFCQVHYIPIHTLPYYANLGFRKGEFPISENYYDECLSLPMYPGLSDEEQLYVIQSILNFFER